MSCWRFVGAGLGQCCDAGDSDFARWSARWRVGVGDASHHAADAPWSAPSVSVQCCMSISRAVAMCGHVVPSSRDCALRFVLMCRQRQPGAPLAAAIMSRVVPACVCARKSHMNMRGGPIDLNTKMMQIKAGRSAPQHAANNSTGRKRRARRAPPLRPLFRADCCPPHQSTWRRERRPTHGPARHPPRLRHTYLPVQYEHSRSSQA